MGRVAVAGAAQQVAVDPLGVPLVQLAERSRVAPRSLQELGVAPHGTPVTVVMGSSMIGDVHDMARRAPDVALDRLAWSTMSARLEARRGWPPTSTWSSLTGDVEAALTPGRFEPLLGERERLVRAS